MDNTSAAEQWQVLQEEFHGPENLQMRKQSLLFRLPSSMVLNGSKYDQDNKHTRASFFFFFPAFFFFFPFWADIVNH